MKTKEDKKVNKTIRYLNKQLSEDVFEDRFYIRQVSKHGYADTHDYHYYVLEFIDRKCPERNFIKAFSESEITFSAKAHMAMNNFIVESDFWKTFDKESWFKDKSMCFNCKQYRNFKIKTEKITENVDGKDITYWGKVMYCKRCGSKMHAFHETEVYKRNKERLDKALKEVDNV